MEWFELIYFIPLLILIPKFIQPYKPIRCTYGFHSLYKTDVVSGGSMEIKYRSNDNVEFLFYDKIYLRCHHCGSERSERGPLSLNYKSDEE